MARSPIAATLGERASGHVMVRRGKRGAVFYAKFRLPDGRQVQQRIGPAWTGRGRPPEGSRQGAASRSGQKAKDVFGITRIACPDQLS